MAVSALRARILSRDLLADALPRRWSHVCSVAQRAQQIDSRLEQEAILEIAAWLHDVGYAPRLAVTGFHPLDGARYLQSIGVSARLVGLVAFHSSAATEAEAFGVADELAGFDDERSLTRDLLWYLDMTTGPDGNVLTFERRMAEIRERCPSDHYVVRALDVGMGEPTAAVERAKGWLSASGLADQV